MNRLGSVQNTSKLAGANNFSLSSPGYSVSDELRSPIEPHQVILSMGNHPLPNEAVDVIRDEINRPDIVDACQELADGVGRINDSLVSQLSHQGGDLNAAVVALMETGELSGSGATRSVISAIAPNPPIHDPEQRCATILNNIKKLLANAPSLTPHQRRIANTLNACLRTGLITATTTVIRQMIGFYVQKAMIDGNMSLENRAWLGGSLLMLGPILNLVGFLRDECRHTANKATRTARLSMLGISTAIIGLSRIFPGVTANVSPYLVTYASYTLLRDLANAFFPMNNNIRSIHVCPTLCASLVYSVIQIAAGEAMSALAPFSGPARALKNMPYGIGPDLIRGGINALVEISDDLVSGSLAVAMGRASVSDSQAQQPHDGENNLRLSLPGIHFPDSSRVANQFLNTNAARSSAFLNLTQANSLLDHGLSQLGSLSEQDRGHVVNAVGSLILNILYPPLVYTHAQSQQESSQDASESVTIPMSGLSGGLRQRRTERERRDSDVSAEECRF